jgi:hypothetical protein
MSISSAVQLNTETSISEERRSLQHGALVTRISRS